MFKHLSAQILAVSIACAMAPSAAAHTYAYYDGYGHRHYTHDRAYAEHERARYARRHYAHHCGSAGTKGAVIGGVGGAVLGQAIGHNTAGTLIGAGAGALAGHEIAKSRCRRR